MRLLFEKDAIKNEQLEILREEVAKGVAQLDAGEVLNHSVMNIFEQASLSVESKLTSKPADVGL